MNYIAFVLAAALCAPSLESLHAQALSAAERAEIAQFRDAQARLLASPQSALGMVSLEKLADGDTSIGSSPDSKIAIDHLSAHTAVVRLRGDHFEVLPPAGGFPKDLSICDTPASAGPVTFDPDGTSPVFREGSVSFVLRHKFGYFLVGRDTQAPDLLHFHGLNWYAPEGKYRVTATWTPWPSPRVLRVANILGQVNDETSYGVAEFTLNRHHYRLEPSVEQKRSKPLFFVFRDLTSRTETYPGGRFLDAGMPSNGLSKPGTVVLDFNQARNPLCAFSSHTSCPIPPEGNRLHVAIPAGEKRYHAD